MATRLEIRCINKIDRYNPHERVRAIGGGPGSWRHTQEQAIANIESGAYAYYVNQWGRIVEVVVARTDDGHKYVKTAADGVQPNNLLSLPECV